MASLRPLRFSQLGILIAAVVLVAVFALAFRTVRSFQVASDALLHAQELRVLFTEVGGHLKDLHANTRAHLANGDERALAARKENLREYHRVIARIRELVANDPERRAALQRLEALVTQLLAEYDVYIELRRTQGLAAVAARVNQGDAKQLPEDLRIASNTLQLSLARQVEAPLATVRSDTTFTLFVLGGGMLLAVGLVASVVITLRRDYRTREAAASVLRRQASEIQDLYNHAPCGYHSLDAQGCFVAINDTELAWLGYAREDVIGRMHMRDLLSTASRPAFDVAHERLKAGQPVNDLEVELCRRNGETFAASINASPACDATGRHMATRVSVFDITERKRIELITAHARDYAESIVNTVREPLVILTHDLRVNSANRVFYQKFRTSAAEVVGRPFNEICGGVWAIPSLEAALRRVLPQDSELEDFEVVAGFPDLGRKVLLLSAQKLYRLGNGPTMMLLAVEDITERKESETQLQNLNASLRARSADLEAVNRELESFSYSVSHDLRAPLRHIDYFAGALQKNPSAAQLDAKAQRHLNTISTSARNMGQLIDDLLAFARISRTELRRTRVRLDDVVQETRQILQTESHGREISWAVAPLPDVEGDPSLLRQVFMNLLSNAVKYTRRRADARIEISPQPSEPGEVLIAVRDNGAGFDMKHAEKLFGVFQRLHAATEFEGTGVGLANVRKIVERHGGRIWAEAEVDRGATFYFTLPAARSARPTTSAPFA